MFNSPLEEKLESNRLGVFSYCNFQLLSAKYNWYSWIVVTLSFAGSCNRHNIVHLVKREEQVQRGVQVCWSCRWCTNRFKGLRDMVQKTPQSGERLLSWMSSSSSSVQEFVCLCLDLINLFGIKVFFRMWFQEYKEIMILNLVLWHYCILMIIVLFLS